MLFTPHALIGAAIGAALPSPVFAFFAGILSHHIADALPHFDQGSLRVEKAGPRYLGMQEVREPRRDFNRRDWLMLFFDMAISGVIFGALYLSGRIPLEMNSAVLWGIFGGLIPDIIGSSPLWYGLNELPVFREYRRVHSYFHWTVAKNEKLLGLGTQFAVSGAALLCIVF